MDKRSLEQAVILAGGIGSRLAPLTDTTPKPMIRFHEKPFLEYLIELLREQGIKKILLLLGYLPEQVIEHFGDGSRFGVCIEYDVTPVENETGMRLKLAREKIDPLFLFLYCDNYLPFSLSRMKALYRSNNALALVTVYNNEDGYTKSNLKLDDTGKILVYDKSRTTPNLKGVDIGYMITDRKVLDLIPEGNVSFEKSVYPRLVINGELYGSVTGHRYYSVGDHRRLPMTTKFLLREKSILVDRDGVLNKKAPRGEYVRNWSEWRWIDGAKEALRILHENGYRIIVVSNQAGIARGALTHEDLKNIHEQMSLEVRREGGEISAIFYCPHHWDEGCYCRKPNPGMLLDAQKQFHLDLSRTYFLGDDDRDGLAGEAAGAPWIKITEERPLLCAVQELVKR